MRNKWLPVFKVKSVFSYRGIKTHFWKKRDKTQTKTQQNVGQNVAFTKRKTILKSHVFLHWTLEQKLTSRYAAHRKECGSCLISSVTQVRHPKLRSADLPALLPSASSATIDTFLSISVNTAECLFGSTCAWTRGSGGDFHWGPTQIPDTASLPTFPLPVWAFHHLQISVPCGRMLLCASQHSADHTSAQKQHARFSRK